MPTPDVGDAVQQTLPFGRLEIAFDDRVLRPRPWTEAQSTWAVELLPDRPTTGLVLELCTGAGHIGLWAMVQPRAGKHRLVAVDVDPAACEFARLNAASAGLADRVEVREGRIDSVLGPAERFDLVIADPPWVPRADAGRFPDDPLVAIDGGGDGLDVAWACLRAIETHLVPGGSAVLQLGSVEQADRVRDRLQQTHSTLAVNEVRSFDRGVLVRLDQSA